MLPINTVRVALGYRPIFGRDGLDTDPWFYALFRRFPDQLFRLAGIRAEGRWRMESVTVKTTEKRIDALLFRIDKPGMLVFAEFQGWADPTIYWRLYREITSWYESRPGNNQPFVALVLFLDGSMDPGDPPLDPRPPSRFVKLTIAEGLDALGEDVGPLVVFRPLVVPDLATAKAEARQWAKTLEGLNLPEADASLLKEHLVDILMRRFKDLSLEEVKAMIELAPLHETRAGRELIAIGRQEGLEKGLQKGLQKGLRKGLLVGKIQMLEGLLGMAETPTEELAQESFRALERRIAALSRKLQQVGH